MTRTIEIAAGSDPAALQHAIDTLAVSGGGRAALLAGRHETGPIRLRDHVELHLGDGAVLAPIPDHAHYADNTSSRLPEVTGRCMIYAVDVNGISITGTGTIEGGGSQFIAGDDAVAGVFIPAEPRLRVAVFENCQHVHIGGITIVEASSWTLHFIHCEDVVVEGYRVLNDMRMPNTDGLVLDGCSRVRVSNAVIRTADDGIVLKTSRSDPQRHCADITIDNCVIESGSCAIKIGTETFGNFDRISVEHCTLQRCNRGLGILSRDGGHVHDVIFRHVNVDCHETPFGFWGSGEALTITQLDRRSGKPAGTVQHVTVEALTGTMEGAINFYSAEPGRISDVRLRHVRLEQRPGILGTGRQYDIRPTEADLVPSKDAAGRVGAWVRDESGAIVGLVDYPGGMPGLFSHNLFELAVDDVEICRPDRLPPGWNRDQIWLE